MKIRNFLLFALLLATQIVPAQNSIPKIDLGINYIKNEYDGDYGTNVFKFDQINSAFGLSLTASLSPSFDVGLQSTYGEYGFRVTETDRFVGTKFDASLFGHYKFNNGYILKKDSKLSPFVSLGLGIASYGLISADANALKKDPTFNPTIIPGVDIIVPFGIGLKYQISNKIAVQYQYLYNLSLGINADNHDTNRGKGWYFYNNTTFPENKRNDFYGQHWLSLIIELVPADADGDGVPDRRDKCPNTPKGVKVDKFGCPLDKDRDGVPDYLDKCSGTPKGAKVDADGCPLDSDGDGVPDYLDKCSDSPIGVKVDANGCPLDSDGDGVPDYIDKEANTPKGAKVDVNGYALLDTDGDGVPDNIDKCPNTPKGAKVDKNGCMLDSDNDGIPDYLDKCPDTQKGVKVDKNGCPPVSEATPPVRDVAPVQIEKRPVDKVVEPNKLIIDTKNAEKRYYDLALPGIQFEKGRDVLLKSSFVVLNQLAQLMVTNPTFKLEIYGHTDNTGDPDRNIGLSQKRCEAVKRYLLSKNIENDRIVKTIGFGQLAPIADNNTKEGREKNRRVEFRITF
ncbi:MAG: thrombospondin type 3 repeat-containing protein [Paludibacter sp.]